ncbi:MAG: hypothetical protein F4Z79_06625 [Acidimicrobiia bacterium]|nr:hypothetical protein [Acidimicrobiia bacterium]
MVVVAPVVVGGGSVVGVMASVVVVGGSVVAVGALVVAVGARVVVGAAVVPGATVVTVVGAVSVLDSAGSSPAQAPDRRADNARTNNHLAPVRRVFTYINILL